MKGVELTEGELSRLRRILTNLKNRESSPLCPFDPFTVDGVYYTACNKCKEMFAACKEQDRISDLPICPCYLISIGKITWEDAEVTIEVVLFNEAIAMDL